MATTSYTYSPSGALASVTTPTASIAYTSDARGLRQSRTVDGVTDQFTWSSVGGLSLLLDDGDHSYVYGPSSTPIAQVDDSTGVIEYLHADLLGTPRLLTDASGAVVGSVSFDAFGNRATSTGTQSAFGFTGNWSDPDTGLLYLRARDYDPATGQFLIVDPAVDATRQPYAYAGNNPISRTDPTGLDYWDDNPWAGLNKTFNGAVDALEGGFGFVRHAANGCDIGVLLGDALEYQLGMISLATTAVGGGLVVGALKPLIKQALTGALKSLFRTGIREASEGGLSAEVKALAESNITNSGTTVLGSFERGYIQHAQAREASYFDIGSAWGPLTPSQRWAANTHFLDTRIAAGDTILFNIPKSEISRGTILSDEVDYMLANGYRWVNQWSMRPIG